MKNLFVEASFIPGLFEKSLDFVVRKFLAVFIFEFYEFIFKTHFDVRDFGLFFKFFCNALSTERATMPLTPTVSTSPAKADVANKIVRDLCDQSHRNLVGRI